MHTAKHAVAPVRKCNDGCGPQVQRRWQTRHMATATRGGDAVRSPAARQYPPLMGQIPYHVRRLQYCHWHPTFSSECAGTHPPDSGEPAARNRYVFFNNAAELQRLKPGGQVPSRCDPGSHHVSDRLHALVRGGLVPRG